VSGLTPFGQAVKEAELTTRKGKNAASEMALKFKLPSDEDARRIGKLLRRYGITVDMKALAAERAVAAGYPVKDLSGILGKDYMLYQVIRDLHATNNRSVRTKLIEVAGALLGLINNGQGGSNQFNTIHISELGTTTKEPMKSIPAEASVS
jgi:hypothetical protein